MATITAQLIMEHAVFSGLFDEIERVLAETEDADAVNLLARLVEAVLLRHRDIEVDLAFSALDQQLAERGELDRLHRDHQEIDDQLRQAKTTTDHAEAVRLLKAALRNSRNHFRREEKTVFPLFEKVFLPDTLEALGNTTMHSYLAAADGRTRVATGAT